MKQRVETKMLAQTETIEIDQLTDLNLCVWRKRIDFNQNRKGRDGNELAKSLHARSCALHLKAWIEPVRPDHAIKLFPLSTEAELNMFADWWVQKKS